MQALLKSVTKPLKAWERNRPMDEEQMKQKEQEELKALLDAPDDEEDRKSVV